MAEKFNTNNDSEFPLSEDNMDANYSANSGDEESLYVEPKSHRHLKFWSFLILVLFILFIVGYRFYSNIYDPLSYDVPDWVKQDLAQEEDQARTIEELKASDTDQDGLSDYQEIYQYYTSIFLPDTDSDGFTDAEEVNIGEDPLCPINESCNLLRLITPSTRLSSIVQDINLNSDITVQDAAIQEFRKFLLESGEISQEELAELSDEDLLAIFQIVDESNIFTDEELSASTTPEEVRNFLLLLPGADANEINALSDEELMSIAQKLIDQ